MAYGVVDLMGTVVGYGGLDGSYIGDLVNGKVLAIGYIDLYMLGDADYAGGNIVCEEKGIGFPYYWGAVN